MNSLCFLHDGASCVNDILFSTFSSFPRHMGFMLKCYLVSIRSMMPKFGVRAFTKVFLVQCAHVCCQSYQYNAGYTSQIFWFRSLA